MTQTKQQLRYQQNKKYSQTENGKKTIKFASWRKQGLDGDYEKIYRRYMRTTVCDLCGTGLEGLGRNKKCMEHNHATGQFRNVVCHCCNSSKTDRKKQINCTSGFKNVLYDKYNKRWVYSKLYLGRQIKRSSLSKIDCICMKFAGLLLYKH